MASESILPVYIMMNLISVPSFVTSLLLILSGLPQVLAQPVELNIQMVPGIWINGATGAVNIEYTTNLDQASGWMQLANVQATNSPYFYIDASATNAPKRFYRAVVVNSENTNSLTGMALIPAGSFQMGDALDNVSFALPVHTVYVSAFYMDKNLVTKALWDEVYTWATAHGYKFDNAGSGKAATHPVHTVSWYDMVKWCNARSEKEGRVAGYYTSEAQTTVYRTGQVDVQNDWVKWNTGYRLPTEAEWEKAARGGLSGKRFPWGDTITHSQANYSSISGYDFDISTTKGYHPSYDNDPMPYTSPVGSFAPNGYGLYDMAGNLWEGCWDWYGTYSGGSMTVTDPRGATTGSNRVGRGGSWYYDGRDCRSAYRIYGSPVSRNYNLGFRSVLAPGQ